MVKGASEKEIASLQAEVAKQAKEVAAQARKLADSHSHSVGFDPKELKVFIDQSEAEQAQQTAKEIRKHITVMRSDKEGEPITLRVDEDEPLAMKVEVRKEGDKEHVIVKEIDRKDADGNVMILRHRQEDPKAEIEALKKAIEKMQGRLEKLQKEAASKDAPAK
jgi:hypothetical protein